MSYASYTIGNLEQQVRDLEEKNTILKAERDEAIRTRDEVHQQLMNLLAVIHRDGGQYVGEHGVAQAITDAHGLVMCWLAGTPEVS